MASSGPIPQGLPALGVCHRMAAGQMLGPLGSPSSRSRSRSRTLFAFSMLLRRGGNPPHPTHPNQHKDPEPAKRPRHKAPESGNPAQPLHQQGMPAPHAPKPICPPSRTGALRAQVSWPHTAPPARRGSQARRRQPNAPEPVHIYSSEVFQFLSKFTGKNFMKL